MNYSRFFEKLVLKQNKYFFGTISRHYYSSIALLKKTAIVKPPRKYTPEEKAAYDQARVEKEASQHDLNRIWLKQEGISRFEDSRNCGTRRNWTDNDEISVVSASKRPKELKGHNKFETAKYWDTPTR